MKYFLKSFRIKNDQDAAVQSLPIFQSSPHLS